MNDHAETQLAVLNFLREKFGFKQLNLVQSINIHGELGRPTTVSFTKILTKQSSGLPEDINYDENFVVLSQKEYDRLKDATKPLIGYSDGSV